MRITQCLHNKNFISEFETDLDCTEILEYFQFINQNGLIHKRNTGSGAKDTQVFVHELPIELFHDSLNRRVYQQ